MVPTLSCWPHPIQYHSIAVRCKKVVPSAGNVTIDRQVALWTDECLVIELQVGLPEPPISFTLFFSIGGADRNLARQLYAVSQLAATD